jgi:hypothetical protein
MGEGRRANLTPAVAMALARLADVHSAGALPHLGRRKRFDGKQQFAHSNRSEAKGASDTSFYAWSRLRFAIALQPAVLHACLKNRPTSRLPALFNRRLASAP